MEAAAAPGVPATTQATILDFVDDAKDTVTVVALLEGSKSRERGVGAAAAGLDSVNDGAGGLCCAATDGSSCFLILVVVVAGKKRNAPLVFSKKTDGRTDYIPRGLFSRQRSRLQSENTKILHSKNDPSTVTPDVTLHTDADTKQTTVQNTNATVSHRDSVVVAAAATATAAAAIIATVKNDPLVFHLHRLLRRERQIFFSAPG